MNATLSIINIILIASLVGITFLYTISTKAMADEMVKARKLQLEPYIRGYLRTISSVGFDIRIINTGLGAAEQVKFTLYVDNHKLEQQQYLNLLLPNHYEDYALIKNPQTKEHLFYFEDYRAYNTLTIELEYRNVLGEISTSTQVLDIKEELTLSKEGIRYARQATIDKIENNLQGIVSELKSIKDKIK